MVYARLMNTQQLGHTNIYVSPIGLGTAQFAGTVIPITTMKKEYTR
jgi:aryl-alcohol dehydrogenase-like predicted oxidoreductase